MAEIIFGIDHGNGNMKGETSSFPCGIVRYTAQPGRFMNEDILEYEGAYYTLSETKMPFKADKTVDDDYFILTLFTLVQEARKKNINLTGKDVVLGVGLPPADFGQQAVGFKQYFIDHSRHGINFRMNDKPVSFYLKDVFVSPQNFAAVMCFKASLLKKYRTVNCIDIGDGTVDLLVIRNGKPDLSVRVSERSGMAVLRSEISNRIQQNYGIHLDSSDVEQVLMGEETILEEEILKEIYRMADDWVHMIINKLHAHVTDIKGFFQHLDHEWIVRFIESRIKDPNIIRLVRRMLKAGIMNNYEFEATEEGSGQGSVCSPIISCIYMHYVLIWWFKEVVTPMLKGYAGLVVYADDFVVTFQYKSDAVWFYEHLKHRMGHFGLSLEEEKSRLIEFGRYAKERCSKSGTKPGTFTFLGFTHYCSKSKNGRFRVKRKTSKKKFAKKCREINQLMGHMKTWKLKEITAKLNQILTGYYHYYGITDNTERITAFRYHVMKSLFYCLNRRSQKKSYNWVEFLNMIDNSYPLVRPRIYVSVYN